MVKLTETYLHKVLMESVEKLSLNEKRGLKSQKLFDILQQHGGLGRSNMHHTAYGNFSNLNDEDIIGVMSRQEVRDIENGAPTIDHWRWSENLGLNQWAKEQGFNLSNADEVSTYDLKDGNLLVYIDRNARFDRVSNFEPQEGDWKSYYDKTEARRKSRANDGARDFVPTTPKSAAARDFRKNPYPWANKNGKDRQNGWNSERRTEAMNNIRNGKDAWGYNPRKNGNAYYV